MLALGRGAQCPGLGNHADDIITQQLMNLLDGDHLLRRHQLVPEVHHLLVRQRLDEADRVLNLGVIPILISHVGHQLIQDCQRLRGFHLLGRGFGNLAGQHHLSRHLKLILADELSEGNGCLGAHVSGAQCVEAFRPSASNFGGHHAAALQCVIQPVPGGRGRADSAALHSARIDPEMTRILADEVDGDRVDAVADGPVQPVLQRVLNVLDPEPTKQGRVDITDVIFDTEVARGPDPGARMELHRVAVAVIAQLTVQDHLEEGLHHLRHGAIDFVQHQQHRLPAGPDEPGGEHEGGDTQLLGGHEVGDAGHLGLIHGGATDVDEGQTQLFGCGHGQEALANPGRSAHQNGVFRGKFGGELFEGFDIHLVFPLQLWGLSAPVTGLLYHAARRFTRVPLLFCAAEQVIIRSEIIQSTLQCGHQILEILPGKRRRKLANELKEGLIIEFWNYPDAVPIGLDVCG